MTVRCGDYYTLQSERARAAHSGARALARQLRACARGCGGNGTRADLSARHAPIAVPPESEGLQQAQSQRNGRSQVPSNETQNFDQSSARPNLTQISSQSYPHPNLETNLIKVWPKAFAVASAPSPDHPTEHRRPCGAAAHADIAREIRVPCPSPSRPREARQGQDPKDNTDTLYVITIMYVG